MPTVAASHLQKQCSTAREAVIKKEEITIEMLGDEGYFDMPLSVSGYCLELGEKVLLFCFMRHLVTHYYLSCCSKQQSSWV